MLLCAPRRLHPSFNIIVLSWFVARLAYSVDATPTPDTTFKAGDKARYKYDGHDIIEWLPGRKTWRVATTDYWQAYRFRKMIEEAQKLGHSQAGAAYEKQVLPLLTNGLQAAVANCTKKAAVMEPFDIVYIIAGDGSVTAAVFGQLIWRCAVENSQIPAQVPAPPHAPWIIAAHVTR